MKLNLYLIFSMLLISVEVFSQEPIHDRRRTRESRRPTIETRLQDCQNNGCNCCIVRDATHIICPNSNENSNDPNITTIWGNLTTEHWRGNEFRFYNFSESQKELVREVINVIPESYLIALPIKYRIGVPATGSLTPRTSDIIGGGARRCHVKNDLYDYIIIHPNAFIDIHTNVRLTILHEIGHFVDREYQLSERYSRMPEYSTHFSEYLTSTYSGTNSDGVPITIRYYDGDSRGNTEVIAQGIACYHYRKNWASRNPLYPPDGVWHNRVNDRVDPNNSRRRLNPYGHPFPIWLRSIIRDHLGVDDTQR